MPGLGTGGYPPCPCRPVPGGGPQAYCITSFRRRKMKKKLIGQVTPEEKNEIQTLFERRNGLNELAKIVTADNAELYERLVRDLGETGTKFQSWWDRMGGKYQWESAEGGNWEINFDTCEIFLVQND